MRSKKIWTLFLILTLAVTTFLFRDSLTTLWESRVNAQTTTTEQPEGTVTIRSATDTTTVSAAGNIALADQQTAVTSTLALHLTHY